MNKNPRKRAAPTVSVRVSNRRAGDELELLFDRLERFANLGDDLGEFETFARNYPRFLPVEFYDSKLGEAARHNPLGWRPEFFNLFRAARDVLRDVWER